MGLNLGQAQEASRFFPFFLPLLTPPPQASLHWHRPWGHPEVSLSSLIPRSGGGWRQEPSLSTALKRWVGVEQGRKRVHPLSPSSLLFSFSTHGSERA